MKQTAVEWLVDEMIQRKFFEKETELSYTTLEHLTNQAKEMEKEQQLELIQFLADREDFKEHSSMSIFIAEDYLNQFKNK